MNVTFWTLLICFQVAAISAKLSHRNHSCVPSSYSKICILENLLYKHDEKGVTHSFPPNQTHIRILSDLAIDAKLYGLLGQPRILEVEGHDVHNLEIPRGLRHGSFENSYVHNLTVEAGSDIPMLIFLDLTDNYLNNISAVKSLINLEVLLLSDNFISSIDPSTMKDLTKLRHLDLSFNGLSRLSLNVFPKSLTHLYLHNSHIATLHYKDLYYSSLEVINIERSDLTSIDGPALVLAMPKLKMARVGGNKLQREDLLDLLDFFKRRNISFRDEADEAACWRKDDEIIEGVCLVSPSPPRTVFRDILFSLGVIAMASAMVLTLRWVYRVMNGSK